MPKDLEKLIRAKFSLAESRIIIANYNWFFADYKMSRKVFIERCYCVLAWV